MGKPIAERIPCPVYVNEEYAEAGGIGRTCFKTGVKGKCCTVCLNVSKCEDRCPTYNNYKHNTKYTKKK